MDFKNIPNDPFECRIAFLREGFDSTTSLTVSYVQNEYPRKSELYHCLDFMSYSLLETIHSDFETLSRVWLFPTVEATDELNECLHKILLASYKSGYDNLRRALELVVVGAYFSLIEIDVHEAKMWLNSQRETPLFSRAIKALLRDKKVRNLETNSHWITNLKNFYWRLSDIIHTRGKNFSLEAFQPSNFSYNGIRITHYSKESLKQLLDTFIETFKNICTCIAITNPILLIGLPIEEKYGINPPSGFFKENQAKDLQCLLVPETKSFFETLVSTDIEINSIANWMNSLPDLSEDEIENQINDFEKLMSDLKKDVN
jgi:hypothetical protein